MLDSLRAYAIIQYFVDAIIVKDRNPWKKRWQISPISREKERTVFVRRCNRPMAGKCSDAGAKKAESVWPSDLTWLALEIRELGIVAPGKLKKNPVRMLIPKKIARLATRRNRLRRLIKEVFRLEYSSVPVKEKLYIFKVLKIPETLAWQRQKRRFMNCCRRAKSGFLQKTVLFFVGLISSFFKALGWRACRFYPSCSEYAQDALETKFFFTALWIVVKRVLRCHPFSAGGYDPVPAQGTQKDWNPALRKRN